VCERYVIVSNVVEEMDLFLLQEETSGDRMDWSITPTLIKESTILVERLEIVNVGLRSQPVEVADFEVRPLKDQS
jgi:hypothetical protein